jgi:hypothetical protein
MSIPTETMANIHGIAYRYNSDKGANDYSYCPHCGGVHIGMCPRIAYIEYHPWGAVKRVEFFKYPS